VIRNSNIRKQLTKKIDLDVPNASTVNKGKLFVTLFAFLPAGRHSATQTPFIAMAARLHAEHILLA